MHGKIIDLFITFINEHATLSSLNYLLKLRLYHVALGLRTKVHDARLQVAENDEMRQFFKAARKHFFFAWSITDFRGNRFSILNI